MCCLGFSYGISAHVADDSFEVGKEEYSLYRPTCELMMWKSCVTVQLLLLFYIMHLFIYCTVSYSIFIPVWLDHVPVLNFFVFQQLFIPVMIVLASVSENFPVYMIMCILVGTSVATLFLLPWCVKPKPRSVYCSQLYSSLLSRAMSYSTAVHHVHHLPLLFGPC